MNKRGWQLPDVDPMKRERDIVHTIYALAAFVAITGGIYAAAADIGPDLFPEEPEPFVQQLPQWSTR